MSEYSKALLSEETEYQCQPSQTAEEQRFLRVAILSVFIDAAFSFALISVCLPFSLPLWPLFVGIFLSTFYAFRRSNPTALRPLLILLMFGLVLCPTLFVVLLVSSVHDPSRAVRLISVFLPFVPPSHWSPFSVLLPICLVLLCSVIYIYWQLHTFWHCQKHFEQTKRWDRPKAKGYAELYVPDPFLKCGAGEKQPLKQKQKGKEAGESADGTNSSISTRVTLSEVLPDYQVFSLNEDEPETKQKNEGEQQQRPRKGQEERNSRIGSSG